MRHAHLILALVWLPALGCAEHPAPRFAPLAPRTQDPDRHPFRPRPAVYHSPLVWDGVDHTLLRPLSEALAVDPSGEAKNVNALDEVPDSSWFTNRIGQRAFSPADVASGPCSTPPLDPSQPWLITAGKSEGATPGFVVKGPGARKYLIKFDDLNQSPRPTAADVIASRVYYAAGFEAPCNRVVFFDRGILRIAPGAKLSTATGSPERFHRRHLDIMLTHGTRLPDGRYRASSSLWLEGTSLGPFRFDGTRSDDRNDVVAHEDRRELRADRLLAAWLDHGDSRSENTLTTWISTGEGYGWVRHAFLDFSDCFGDVWEPPALGRRMGHEYLFDLGSIAERFVTLGAETPAWEAARFGPAGKVLGYFDVARFDPERWRPYYPIPAFNRMTEHDGAWMARIIAHFSRDHLQRAIATGRLSNPALEQQLLHTLEGRQAKILRRYMVPLSSLANPQVRVVGGHTELCVRDLAVRAHVAEVAGRQYRATLAFTDGAAQILPVPTPDEQRDERCVAFPHHQAVSAPEPARLVLEAAGTGEGQLVLHLYMRGDLDYLLVGLERRRTPGTGR